MKYKINFELVILTLIFIGSLKVLIWESINPNSFSKSQKEKIGLDIVHKVGQ